MKKRYVFLINCLLLFCTHLYAQPSSKQGVMGKRPYELDARQVNRKATFDFTDINKWQIVDANNCKAALSRTSEQIVTVPFSGKIVYETEQPQASFYLSLKQPISVSQAWDCIDLWTFGDHWLWGEPASHTAMHAYVVIEDENKKIHEINTVQAGYSGLVHKYWMLNHVKFTEPFNAKAKFLGIKFKGNYTDVGVKHTLYLSSGYMYKEELKPLSFKPFPEKLPFPLRKETILPSNGNDYSIVIEQTEENSRFIYTDEAGELTYIINKHNPLHDISIHWNEKPFQTITNRKLVLADDAVIENLPAKSIVKKDTVWLESLIQWNNKQVPITFFYTIKQKSLIVGIEQKGNEGIVKEVHTGEIIAANADKIAIPFLKYNHNDRPTILINDNKFSFMMFDWYHTNASNFTVGNPKAQTPFSGGKTIYIPKTDGKRNPAREKLFITVSSDIQEVLPTIDNPASPMRSMQADRLWAINGGANLDTLGKFVTDLRRKGVEKVTIRYHEDFWREGGESYTFKLTPNPQLGVKKIQDYIQFVKNQDWRVGLYTNYTDFAPVNALWNPDWVKQGPKGEWEVSWSRCYAPKPQIAWEQEAILAPQIAKLFNTNHSYCDVHTAVAPSTRVDYDYRTPDAGMMRGVIARYGMLLMNERKAYNGPVFSEGGNHWWYAGLADGNYP